MVKKSEKVTRESSSSKNQDKCKDKKCPDGKICNPDTGRCVSIKGITGKKIPDRKLYPVAALVIFIFVFLGVTAFYLDITQPIKL